MRFGASELVLNSLDEMIWSVIRTQHHDHELASLTLSRHSVTSIALSPVNCKISFRWDSSMSASVNLLASSSRLKSPSLSCFALGRESMVSNISSKIAEGKMTRGHYSDI